MDSMNVELKQCECGLEAEGTISLLVSLFISWGKSQGDVKKKQES